MILQNFESGSAFDPNQEEQASAEQNEGQQSLANPGGIPKLLFEVGYPASKEDLVDYAQDQQAGQEFIIMLEKLPDTQFNSPAEVRDALEGVEEEPGL